MPGRMQRRKGALMLGTTWLAKLRGVLAACGLLAFLVLERL